MPSPGILAGQKIDSVKLERAKQLRREMTSEEKTLWQHLRSNRLDGLHFHRQQVIDGFIVDFYCHGSGLIVELDGPSHESRAEYDRERDAVISARDLRVLRIKNEDVRSRLQEVLGLIAAAARGRT